MVDKIRSFLCHGRMAAMVAAHYDSLYHGHDWGGGCSPVVLAGWGSDLAGILPLEGLYLSGSDHTCYHGWQDIVQCPRW